MLSAEQIHIPALPEYIVLTKAHRDKGLLENMGGDGKITNCSCAVWQALRESVVPHNSFGVSYFEVYAYDNIGDIANFQSISEDLSDYARWFDSWKYEPTQPDPHTYPLTLRCAAPPEEEEAEFGL